MLLPTIPTTHHFRYPPQSRCQGSAWPWQVAVGHHGGGAAGRAQHRQCADGAGRLSAFGSGMGAHWSVNGRKTTVVLVVYTSFSDRFVACLNAYPRLLSNTIYYLLTRAEESRYRVLPIRARAAGERAVPGGPAGAQQRQSHASEWLHRMCCLLNITSPYY